MIYSQSPVIRFYVNHDLFCHAVMQIKVTQAQMKVTRCTIADRWSRKSCDQKNFSLKLAPEIERL